MQMESNEYLYQNPSIIYYVDVTDEVKEPNDLVKLWHISFKMAENIYSIIEDVIKAEFEEDSSDEDYIEVDEEDSFDASSSSESEI